MPEKPLHRLRERRAVPEHVRAQEQKELERIRSGRRQTDIRLGAAESTESEKVPPWTRKGDGDGDEHPPSQGRASSRGAASSAGAFGTSREGSRRGGASRSPHPSTTSSGKGKGDTKGRHGRPTGGYQGRGAHR